MDCLRGMIAGLVMGITVGIALGACNSETVYGFLKQGKREIKRFRRKYM